MAHSSAPPPPFLREYAPWLDLPDPLTEQILERLPLSEYIRFVAVCSKWRSIQRNHRLRFTRLPSSHAPTTLAYPHHQSETRRSRIMLQPP